MDTSGPSGSSYIDPLTLPLGSVFFANRVDIFNFFFPLMFQILNKTLNFDLRSRHLNFLLLAWYI